LTRIESIFDMFKKNDKKIVDYILEYPDKIIHLSIAELAEKCNTSESAIVRFCKHIGYKGYQDLKINIAKEIIQPEKQIQEDIDLNDDISTIKKKIFHSSIQTINDTIEVLQDSELKKAVEALSGARSIEIYGTGGSGSIAFDAQHKFLKIGIKTLAFVDVFLQAMSASVLDERDVVLVITHSGTNLDILHVSKVAKKQGAKVIAITNFSKSPITEIADIKLFTASRETIFRTDAMISRTAQLAVIDTLYTALALKSPEAASENLFKTRDSTTNKRS
jgi:RpiR family carbohydrate utilization transcriptional regulator